MLFIPDEQKLAAEGAIRPHIIAAGELGYAQVRPSMAHMGVMWGQLMEAGHDDATDIIISVAEAWVRNENARAAGVPVISDDEILEGVNNQAAIDAVPDSDWGGLFDFGCQYGQRRQRGQSHTRALYETGEWLRTYYEIDNPWAKPAGPAIVFSRLVVEDNKRYFANDSGRFDWREITAFSLLSRILTGEVDYVREWLRRRKSEGFTITRVILTLDGNYWHNGCPIGRSLRSAPDMPGYWSALDTLVDLHAEAGLYMRVCFLGALEPFGGTWYPDRRDVYEGVVRSRAEQFVVEAAQRLADRLNVVGELANEPTQIGMRRAWDNGALVSLGRKVKAVAPQMLLCGGEDNDGRGVVAPFDYADAHLDRSQGVAGWQWPKRMGEQHVIDQEIMPFVAGENINMGEGRVDGGRDVENQPSVCFGVAAISRARRMAGVCFHWDGGLWTTEPRDETPKCISAWHEAFDAFPMLMDARWRGHWGISAGDYWRDVWPGEDDVELVEDHVRRGRGPWRAFGCGPFSVVFPEPQGWNYKANLDAPAERIAYNANGVFACGIYRRS